MAMTSQEAASIVDQGNVFRTTEYSDFIEDISEIYGNKTRFQIVMSLQVYHELSLTQIAEKIGKTKSTTHRHVRILLKVGIVEESREEKVRGSIKTKYYKLVQKERQLPGLKIRSIMAIEDIEERLKALNILLKVLEIQTQQFDNSVGMVGNYINYISSELKRGDLADFQRISEFFEENQIAFKPNYLTKNQFKRYMDLYDEFHEKVEQLIKESEGKEEQEKHYFILTLMLPLKKLLELGKGI